MDAIKDGAFPPMDEKTRAITPYVMIGSSLAMMLVMCVCALIISLLVIALAPPPGQVDHPEDMPWTKQVPWNVSHGEQRQPQNLLSSPNARAWALGSPPPLSGTGSAASSAAGAPAISPP